MKCSPIHFIFIIIFGSVVYGFSIPKVTLKVLQPKGIQFSLQGSYRKKGSKRLSSETSHNLILFSLFCLFSFFKEDGNVIISDARVFIMLSRSNNMNNLKFIDAQLARDVNGFWSYDDSSVEWSFDDNIEYWLNVETSNLGYYVNKVVKIQGNDDIKEAVRSYNVSN